MKLRSAIATTTILLATMPSGCGSNSSPSTGAGGSSSGGATGGSSTTSSSGGVTGSGGKSSQGGAGGSSSAPQTCNKVSACGGELAGAWEVKSSCLKTDGTADIGYLGLACLTAKITGSIEVTGTFTVTAEGRFTDKTVAKGADAWELEAKCLDLSGTKVGCESIGATFTGMLAPYGYESFACVDAASGGGCTCEAKINATGGLGLLFNDVSPTGKVTKTDNGFSLGDGLAYSHCVKGNELTVTPVPGTLDSSPYTGTIVLQKSGGGEGGAGGGSGGATSGSGGKVGSGGASGGGAGGSTGPGTGGAANGGSTGANGGTTGSTGGSTGGGFAEGPCDIYKAANMPCGAAYSMVRALSKSYTGPLFQVRAGSSSTNNTMSGGTTKDIMPGPDGFVESSTVDAACGTGYCTVSVLYDHSGNGNHLKRAPKGNTAGGASGALDDYESIATKGKVTAGGHQVYSLYMNKVEGYRSSEVGKGMPTGSQPQGTYELADGTRKGSACCWDFGNVTTKPATEWAFMDTICLGHTWWGNSKDANWYGFGIDFEGGVWAGGSKPGDPGYGALDQVGPTNTNNPSMDKAKFALGFIKVQPSGYAIRVADLSTATSLTTGYSGAMPQGVSVGHKGGIVLGVGGDNSNNSWGTFYEGAMVAGFPTDEIEAKVMANIKAVGYAPAQ